MKLTIKGTAKKRGLKLAKKNAEEARENPTITSFSREVVEGFVEEYSNLCEQIKKLDARKSYLASEIKKFALLNGTQDDKGSFYCENDKYVFGQVSSMSIVMRDDIFTRLREMGFEDCIETVEVVNKDLLEKYHNEGALTDENVNSLYEAKPGSPRIYVKKKDSAEDMPEIEQSRISTNRRG